jgi:hypothetical protein
MKANFFSILILTVIFAFFACKNHKNENNLGNEDTTKIEISDINENTNTVENQPQEQQTLVIHGNQIWIRSQPTTGEVIMKLDEGTICEVLEKGKKETIHGSTDFWYKIKYNGQEGWVFGSQTSLKQDAKVLENQDINKFMSDFGNIVQNDFSSLFETDSVFVFDNYFAGLSVTYESINDIKKYFTRENYNLPINYDQRPEFDGEFFQKDGIFIIPRKNEQYVEMWLTEDDRLFQTAKEIDKKIRYYVYVINNSEKFAFYVGETDKGLKVVVVDISIPGEA